MWARGGEGDYQQLATVVLYTSRKGYAGLVAKEMRAHLRVKNIEIGSRLLHSQSGTLQGCLKWSSEEVCEASQLQQDVQVASNCSYTQKEVFALSGYPMGTPANLGR